jgi:lipopolysaccharide/colanic/teichoic acid biosynthesis glycosyltransferase
VTRARRTLDLLVSVGGLLLIAPLLLVIALLVKFEDGGPVFFRHERVGRGGRLFGMWKFRTMVPDAVSIGPELTVGGDRRITRIGKWLRRHKLDEIPQLFNVLAGDMTLVGPRPEVPRYVAMYTPDQRSVLKLEPGITDRASIAFADESALLATAADPERFYVDYLVPEKIRLNLEYADRATPLRDLGVVLETLGYVLPRTSAEPRVMGKQSSDPATESQL